MTMVKGGCCVCDVSCLCAFSQIPISPFFHFMKCFFSLVYIYIISRVARLGGLTPARPIIRAAAAPLEREVQGCIWKIC